MEADRLHERTKQLLPDPSVWHPDDAAAYQHIADLDAALVVADEQVEVIQGCWETALDDLHVAEAKLDGRGHALVRTKLTLSIAEERIGELEAALAKTLDNDTEGQKRIRELEEALRYAERILKESDNPTFDFEHWWETKAGPCLAITQTGDAR